MYERVMVEVSDEVAAFLKYDDMRELRYKWKTDKQKRKAKIRAVFSLDSVAKDGEGEEYLVADMIEDIYNPENRNPLTIIIERESTDGLYHIYASVMTSKQYEMLKYYEQDYSVVDMAALLGLDESSARERLYNALKKAVEIYVMHSNYDILTGLQEFVMKDFYGQISATKYNDLFAAVFRGIVLWTNPEQYELVKFVIGGEYDKKIKEIVGAANPLPDKS